ncbi:hypothetical protein DEALK_18400 [Dehalogenimonas alkenigignens]|uniref:Uncharacterized protein n=1 Tax=Dehalogenimonas alkenigignens TaxID=1217799 RepID=A0A0W0GKC1_9CHLR|nr:hypothetical protein [Dehalogenimonas alkenigignens]KTB48993.1 hypothetical protein DEALK_18400 [Dehalogenimonas alkenigignens]
MSQASSVMGGTLGDVFWDLPPWLYYTPGYDLGLSVYVANPTDVDKEYALLARLSRDTTQISEEALPVFGYTWFKVEPGDVAKLKGALRFSETNAVLTLLLYEKDSGEVIDSAATMLVAPSSSVLPPAWPGAPVNTGSSGFDLSQMMGMILPVLMLGMVASAMQPKKDQTKRLEPGKEPVKQLPLGRGS